MATRFKSKHSGSGLNLRVPNTNCECTFKEGYSGTHKVPSKYSEEFSKCIIFYVCPPNMVKSSLSILYFMFHCTTIHHYLYVLETKSST